MANTTVSKLVFIPAPGVGHIMSTFEFAKLLVNRDQNISINVLIIHPPNSSSVLTTYIQSLPMNPIERIRFIGLPRDQETAPKIDLEAPFMSFYGFINSHRNYVRNAVFDMMSRPGSSRIVGFVADMLCTGMIEVANEFSIPTYVFFTSSAAFLGFNSYIDTLCRDRKKEDVIELSKSDGELRVPSFIKPVPTTVYPAMHQNQDGLDFLTTSVKKFREVKAIMVNTFLELETHAIESFSSYTNFPPVYAVGPVLNLEGVAGKASDEDVIRWLDGQPPSSVVFLCFGSMGSFEEVQLKEIACALERSGHRFVWSLRRRPPLQSFNVLPDDYDDPRSILPDGFLERTNGFGRVIGWAPQVSILAHEAVGGFVSHCGWNSMLESLWYGVPTATWPLYTEQQMNAFQMVVELGLAVDIKLGYKDNVFNREGNTVVVTSEEIENGIRKLMTDEEVRVKVKKMSEMTRATVVEGGSSYASIGRLIQDFIA